MIRLGKLTDYAMLILSQMAQAPASVLSAAVIADALHLSVPTVSKILKILSEGGLVSSIRGSEGGYHLTRPAQAITVADVVTAMEGGLAMTECCERTNQCVISTSCVMKSNWMKINGAIHAMLAKLTIVDMSQPLPRGLLHGE